MRVDLTGHQLDITPSLRRLVSTKLAKIERLMNDAAVSAQVVLFSEKIGCRAEVSLHARDERFLHSAGTGDNFGIAVGTAVDKLAHQAKTVKGKWQERRRRAAPVSSRTTKKKTAGPKRSTND